MNTRPLRWTLAGALLLTACPGKTERLPRKELLDPQTCAECHPNHVAEWEGSMHAYASIDPVFRALNQKGQDETGGELGDFCVRCHAPLAVEEGLTTDGTDLDSLPDHMQGVTCAYCHQVTDVAGTHNNPLKLTVNSIFRAALPDGGKYPAVDPGVHGVAYSKLHDGDDPRSSDLCGSCHDIVTPLGAHIERTYLEWEESIFGGTPASCNSGCHMPGRDDVAADLPDMNVRRVHDHSMPAVDVALTDFPDRERQLALVQQELQSVLGGQLCVNPNNGNTGITLTLENVGAGHSFPSGAGADRRVWVEVEAYDAAGALVYSEGIVGDDDVVSELAEASPAMWTFYDTLLDADGNKTHFFWEAAATEINLLNAAAPDQADPFAHHQSRNFLVLGTEVSEVRVQVRMRPLPLDLLNELVDEGRLDPAVRDAMPTHDVGQPLVWTPETAQPSEGDGSCVN